VRKPRRNKTNCLKAMDKLIADYEAGKIHAQSIKHCHLCLYSHAVGYHCIACVYNIPEVEEKFGLKNVFRLNNCQEWLQIIPCIKSEIPPRLARVKEIRAFAAKLPASCFKERISE